MTVLRAFASALLLVLLLLESLHSQSSMIWGGVAALTTHSVSAMIPSVRSWLCATMSSLAERLSGCVGGCSPLICFLSLVPVAVGP